MRTSIRLWTVLLAGLFMVATAAAQPSITSSTFLSLRGQTHVITEANAAFGSSLTVDVGSPGANQTWDFTSIVLSDPMMYTRAFPDPASTPYAGSFPTANFVFASTIVDDTSRIDLYQYAFVNSSAYTELGDVFDWGDSSIVDISADPFVLDLPVTMNSMWTDVSRDTFAFSGSGVINIDSTINVVDAWGTATVSSGTYDVLRIRADDYSISHIFASGMLIQSDTTRSISFEWISPTQFIVASIESLDDEMNPNFTQASYVSVLSNNSTGVDDRDIAADAPILRSLYPNPAVESVTIEFETSARNVDLGVYDLLGRRIRTLPAASTGGLQSVPWDGYTDSRAKAASGIYLVRIQADNRTETRRLVLTR